MGPVGIANTELFSEWRSTWEQVVWWKEHSICSHADLGVSVGSRHMRNIVLT